MEQNLKTINIKGKEYVEVNERINYFRTNEKYNGWSLETEIIDLNETSCTLKAVIKDNENRIIATGLAWETRDSSMVNSTSYVENCETSAWGRALANLGIGIKAAIASAEEVTNAIKQQQNNYQNQNQSSNYTPQQFNDEIRNFTLEYNGEMYDIPYIKKFSKTKNQFFWLIQNEADADFFPKYMKYEG